MTTPRVKYYIAGCILLLLLFVSTGFYYYHAGKSSKTVPLTNERELKVNLDAGFANISIARGRSATILDATADADAIADIQNCIDYTIRDRIGFLNINTGCQWEEQGRRKKKHSIHLTHLESGKWSMEFTDAVPIAFDIELGFGRADIDLSGIAVKDLSISTGASSVNLTFDQPNKFVVEELNIEAGLSKFTAHGLCNANFRHLKFEGGVGEYSLDFGGKLDREVDADIQVGLGSLVIKIPENVGTKIYYEKSWIAHLDLARDIREREENTYYSENYNRADGKLNMKIEAGLGSVKIRRE